MSEVALMKRSIIILSMLTLLISMLALPAVAKPPVDLHCPASVEYMGEIFEGYKAEFEDFVDGQYLFEGIEGTGGELYDVLVTLGADGKSMTFEVYLAGTETLVPGAEVGFCYKGGPNNTGLVISEGGAYSAVAAGFVHPKSGQVPALSYLMVYLVVTTDTPPPVCDGQTAWAANGLVPGALRYEDPGNWATYLEYEGVQKTVNVYAGQTILVGTATLSAPELVEGAWMVHIEVDLTGGWQLDLLKTETVKIQGYDTPPSGNPAPGGFEFKGDSLEVWVSEAGFYGIHLDVALCE
jgi:hypothetical protein